MEVNENEFEELRNIMQRTPAETGRYLNLLNAKIAGEIMGWTSHICGNWPWQMQSPELTKEEKEYGTVRNVPKYSTDLNAAFEVITILQGMGYTFGLGDPYMPYDNPGSQWTATFANFNTKSYSITDFGDTAAEAICNAALRVMEYNLEALE